MPKSYPKWAPESLCDKHKELLEVTKLSSDEQKKYFLQNRDRLVMRSIYLQKNIKLLEQLIFYPDMKYVWPQLKRHRLKDTQWLNCPDEVLLLDAIYKFYYLIKIDQKSKSEGIKELRKVSKKAQELAKIMKGTDFDGSPRSYHPEYSEEQDDGYLLFLDEQLGFTISNVLEKLAYYTDAAQEYYNPDRFNLLPYPNIPNAQRLAFIRFISISFKRHFGGFLYRTLATVARATLEDEAIDESIVKDALKNWSRNSKDSFR